MGVLTRLDPAAYGMDPLRRIVLAGGGHGQVAGVFGRVLPIPAEAGILLGFGALMLFVAIRNFRVAD